MYKYFRANEIQKFDFYKETLVCPLKPRFHKDWEWTYDFPEIRNKVFKIIKYYYYVVLLYFVCKARLVEHPCYYEYNMKEVGIPDLEEFIFKNIRDSCKYLYNQKCMIIFGPDVRVVLLKLTQSFELSGRFKFQVNSQDGPLLFYQDIPMIYIPTISGVHVLPDATGKWTELVQKPEPTAFGKFRRYY